MLKVIAFDLDGTLTQHKTPLCPENRAAVLNQRLASEFRFDKSVSPIAEPCHRIAFQPITVQVVVDGSAECIGINTQVADDQGFPIYMRIFLQKRNFLRRSCLRRTSRIWEIRSEWGCSPMV